MVHDGDGGAATLKDVEIFIRQHVRLQISSFLTFSIFEDSGIKPKLVL